METTQTPNHHATVPPPDEAPSVLVFPFPFPFLFARPAALISNMFLGFTEAVAPSLSIPRLTFYPSGAYAPNGPIQPTSSSSVITVSDVPGAPSFHFRHLSGLFKECMLSNVASHGSVFNSFADADGGYLMQLESLRWGGQVWGVGPVHLLVENDTKGEDSVQVMEWLEGREEGSVLYVCFGTMVRLNQDQSRSPKGLKTSGAMFFWVMPDHWVLPSGLEESLEGHGAVLRGCAPQAQVLQHKAIGAFLTHYGWNSMLEGHAAGVGVGVGALASEGEGSRRDPGLLAQAVARVMEPGSTERLRARLMGEAAQRAMGPGRSSRAGLESLVER
ncbi:hypothetical protein AMTRI_Chr10g7020 [Amborella trichopoda]